MSAVQWPPCPPSGSLPPPIPLPDVFAAFAWLARNYQESAAARDYIRLIVKDLLAQDPEFLIASQPTKGISDGSNAPAGMVGEELTAHATTTVSVIAAVVAPVYTVVGTLILTPGDWDVYANLFIDFTAGSAVAASGQGYWCFLGPASVPIDQTDPARPSDGVAWMGADWGSFPRVAGGTIGPVRINTTVPAGADLRVVIEGAAPVSGTGSVYWALSARRMR